MRERLRRAFRGAALYAGAAACAAAVALLACGEAEDGWSVERRDLVIEVPLTGELEAVDSVDLGPPPVDRVWEFTIASLAPEGATVAVGDPVLGFDTSVLEREIETAIAERDSAAGTFAQRETDLRAGTETEKLALAEAEGRLRRTALKAGVDEAVLARRDIELARLDRDLAQDEVRYRQGRLESLARRAQSELGSLRAQVNRASEEVNDLRAKIEAMTVRAPRAGRIVYKTDRQGTKKKIGDRVWRLDAVMEIPDLESLRARGEVDEAQSGRVDVGQPVTFRLDAHPDLAYGGRVAVVDRVVRPRSYRNPRSVIAVIVELDRTDVEQMRPGMRIQGAIEVERRAGVVAAPLSALGFDDDGPFVVASGRPRDKRRPALGARNASWVEVIEGLEPGDRLLAPAGGDDSD